MDLRNQLTRPESELTREEIRADLERMGFNLEEHDRRAKEFVRGLFERFFSKSPGSDAPTSEPEAPRP